MLFLNPEVHTRQPGGHSVVAANSACLVAARGPEAANSSAPGDLQRVDHFLDETANYGAAGDTDAKTSIVD